MVIDALEISIRKTLAENRALELSWFKKNTSGYSLAIEEYVDATLNGLGFQKKRFLAKKLIQDQFRDKRTRSESKMLYEEITFLDSELFNEKRDFYSNIYNILSSQQKRNLVEAAHKNDIIVNALYCAVQLEGMETAMSKEYVSNVTKQIYEDPIEFIGVNQHGFLEPSFIMIDVYESLKGENGIRNEVLQENLLEGIKNGYKECNASLREIYDSYLLIKANIIWSIPKKKAHENINKPASHGN